MRTIEELKTEIQRHLLRVLPLGANPWPHTRSALHQKYIGRLCYEAEEALDPADLKKLKKALGLVESRWKAYKSRFIHFPPEED